MIKGGINMSQNSLNFIGILGFLWAVVFFFYLFQSLFFGLFMMAIGIGVFYFCYRKVEDLKEEQLWEKSNQTYDFLQSKNFTSSNRYISLEGGSIFIDENQNSISLENKFGQISIYKYRDILSSEITSDGETIISTNRGSQLGGALLGGLIGGGIGAVIGGLSGSQTSESKIKNINLQIVVNDTKNPVFNITFLKSQLGVYKNSTEYKNSFESANYWYNLISVLIRKADEEDRIKETKKQPNIETLSIADEISKLVSLKEQGILTEDEFNQQKLKLLV
jgi:hypothetical protein